MPDMIQVRILLPGTGAIIGKEVPTGTTAGELLTSVSIDAADSNILVNGSPVSASYVLQSGDSVTLSIRNAKMA